MEPFDCETFDTALVSLSRLLQMNEAALKGRLRKFDFYKLSTEEQNGEPVNDLLVKHSLGVHPRELPVPSLVYWFHGTRVPYGTTFDDGILPLPARLERIWDFLGSLAAKWSTPIEWEHFRKNMKGNGAQQYFLKLAEAPQYNLGPFGVLVRATLLNPGSYFVDYLGSPEIIQDICDSYMATVGHNLQAEFLAATNPCIVKFLSTMRRPDVVAHGLRYLHTVLIGDELSDHANTCFDSQGKPIPKSDIVDIQWPNLA